MPHESDTPDLSPEQIDRALFLFQDEAYLRGLDSREEAESHERFMDLIDQGRAERAAAAAKPTTDFRAIMDENISKAKRIPIERLEEDRAAREEAAQRDAEHGFTNLESARLTHFGGKKPVLHEGQVVDYENPNEHLDQPTEVRKGTHSRKVHKPKATNSTTLRRPIKPHERKKPGYDHEHDPSNPRLF